VPDCIGPNYDVSQSSPCTPGLRLSPVQTVRSETNSVQSDPDWIGIRTGIRTAVQNPVRNPIIQYVVPYYGSTWHLAQQNPSIFAAMASTKSVKNGGCY